MNYLTVVPREGLCNRLRVMFSWLAEARSRGSRLKVFWKDDDRCPGHFLDVFAPIGDVTFLKHKPRHIDYEGYARLKSVPHNGELYRDLSPLLCVTKSVAKFPHNAIHVRRTDFAESCSTLRYYRHDIDYARFIEQCRFPVYLATDNDDTQDAFYRLFEAKVFWHRRIHKCQQLRQTTVRHAVIDIMSCVNALSFFGQPGSAFSELIQALRSRG